MFHHPPYFFCISTKIVLIYKIIFANYYTIIFKKNNQKCRTTGAPPESNT